MQVERDAPSGVESGERVSNAYATYPIAEDSPGKLGLILHSIQRSHGFWIKVEALWDRRACY